MISHAAATDIPMAHPITPPKLAAIQKRQKVNLWFKKFLKLSYPAYQQLCNVGL